MDNQIKEAVVMYRTARDAIVELGGPAESKRYQKIERSDLKMSGDIVEENRVGQRNSILPWFWSVTNVLVGPGVENQVQLAAIDCCSVACVLERQKREVTRVGPTDPKVSTRSGVSGVFLEWIQEVRSYNRVREVRRSESRRDSARQAKPEAEWRKGVKQKQVKARCHEHALRGSRCAQRSKGQKVESGR